MNEFLTPLIISRHLLLAEKKYLSDNAIDQGKNKLYENIQSPCRTYY
jgi:hypothetical protein